MRIQALLTELHLLGVKLEADGNRLRYAGPNGAISPKLIEHLKPHKIDLLVLLQRVEKDKPKGCPASLVGTRESRWPVECLDAERRFGHRAARLYPLINRRVETQQGTGKLWQVFSEQAGVVLESHPERVKFVKLEEVAPLARASRERK